MLSLLFRHQVFKRPLFYILLLSFLLNLYAIWWGLPSFLGWAMDEILPYQVWDGISERFSNGWHSKYAPFHFYILSILYIPVWLLSKLKLLDFYDLPVYSFLYYVGRCLSLVMGTTSIYITYLCGRELLSKRAALFSSLIVTLTVTVIYYSKTVNLDIPYVFWFCLSLLFYIKILKHHRLRDYILFAATATTSVCTKDQAYGLYILTVLFIVFELYQYKNRQHPRVSAWNLICDRRIYLPIAIGVSLFAIYHNFLFNWDGFVKHLDLILGDASYSGVEISEENKHNWIEQLRLFHRFFKDLVVSFGVPLFAVCLSGVVLALRKPRNNQLLLSTLVVVISYYICFLMPIAFCRERFLIPVCIVLSLFGGKSIDGILNVVSNRLTQILVSALFVYSFFYGSSIDLLMHQDSRYYVENWMQQNLQPGDTLTMYGIERYLPRENKMTDFEVKIDKTFEFEDLVRESPQYIVTTSLMNLNTYAPSSPRWNFFVQLYGDDSGYDTILKHKTKPTWNLLYLDDYEVVENPRYRTGNLNKINPEITILKRRDEL
ncbi:hypothetical protein CKA32_006361 [Geitlerinema sp. FC II]|nr:hypothetical protein CKA32_006361 [Geitlerinema sp. FC II]